MSPELWKERLENNLLIDKFINTKFKVTIASNETGFKKYYESHKEKFKKGQMVYAIHIMVATEDEAYVVRDLIKSGDKSFSELAKMYSIAPEASVGGDLGYFDISQMPEEFEQIVKLKKQQVSEVIKTPHGYHIFKVIDIKIPKQLSFPESKDTIKAQFLRDEQSRKFEQWLIELKRNANIKINKNVFSETSL